MRLILTLKNIYKVYKNKPVLKDCSFSFSKDGVYVLMGPNGSGKSTLLRIAALLEQPDKGEVLYQEGERILSKNLSLKRRITLLLPEVGVFNSSVFENIAYGLKIRGLSKKEIRERVEEALDFVNLLPKKNQDALTLSSGELKRMGIARAMVINPEVLFLDEPTAFVDYENVAVIENILTRLKEKLNTLVIIATHDTELAKKVGDFLLVLQEGELKPFNF
jgi:tungstate transport system ATP-binding protein